jgi:hypothetical protein
MANENHSIRPYEGKSPYLFVSCQPGDWDSIAGILEQMRDRGLRLWLSNSIPAGLDRDEVIAEHLEGCSGFVSFLSEAYLNDLDVMDELNYARDLNKNQLLVYIRPTQLSAGLQMRIGRLQSLYRADYPSDRALFEALMQTEGISRFYGVDDPALAAKVEKKLAKLEAYYPDHRVFALRGIDQDLAESLSALCAESEYETTESLLQAYGFRVVRGEEIQQLRAGAIPVPGSEPEVIRPALENALRTLAEYYPTRTIADPLMKKHKALHTRLYALQQWLGYEDMNSFLEAYGFHYLYRAVAGRHGRGEEAYRQIVEQLREKYRDREKPKNIAALSQDNPDFIGVLKTMQNSAIQLFGMPLREYLQNQDVLAARVKEDEIGYSTSMIKALNALRERYADGAHGSVEEAVDRLSGISLRLYKGDEIWVTRAEDCDEELVLPWGIDGVREGAFADNEGLRSVELPETCTQLSQRAFANCSALEEVKLPEGLESLEPEIFAGCTALTRIRIPASVRIIRPGAFRGCGSLAQVELQNLRTSVFEDAFEGCPYQVPELDAGDLQLEYTVDKKNRATVTGFSGVGERLEIPEMVSGHPVVTIAKDVFTGHKELREIVLPDTVTAVQGDAFRGCSGLERLRLSNGISKLTASSFAECVNLREVNIPEAMPEVKRGLFKDSPVELLQLPKTTQRVDPNAFFHREYDPMSGKLLKGKTMRRVVIDPANPYLRASGTCLLSADGKVLQADLGDAEEITVPEGVERIGDNAFQKNQFLHSLQLPSTLRSIGPGAFAETGLESIRFPEGLLSIEEKAFSFCRSLAEAPLPEGLERIGNQAFEGCPIREIRLPASLRELGSNCFAILSLYQGEVPQSFEVAMGNDIYHTDGQVLYWARGEERTVLKAYAYDLRNPYGVSEPADKRYTIEPGTTAIGDQAFARCDRLCALEVPDTLRSIGQQAFLDCRNLQECNLKPGLEIGPMAFAGSPLQN